MQGLPKKLNSKLDERSKANALRQLAAPKDLIDFSSNDYLGFSKSESIYNASHELLKSKDMLHNGATGSRLLSGNHNLYGLIEDALCTFHESKSALVYNSGYDANVGFFSCVPQRGDVIFYDAYSHASIRDGISMSKAKAYKFKHNDLEHLKELLKRLAPQDNIYIVTESVFSMDGDVPDLKVLANICTENKAHLIIDEAHAVGVFGKQGEGLVQELKIEKTVFARIVTFGKALGCHGAAILCDLSLKDYLVNYSRSFIYSTALPPHSLACINSAYKALSKTQELQKLQDNINFFKIEILKNKLDTYFMSSDSAIHACIMPGNDKVTFIAKQLQDQGFDVKPILSPTVPFGEERLRFCLHSFNSHEDISNVLSLLATFVL